MPMRERNPSDRRTGIARPGFPLRDSSGELVRAERRRQPDRRLAGIEVEWLEDKELFEYQK
jgi:hypothetical protein